VTNGTGSPAERPPTKQPAKRGYLWAAVGLVVVSVAAIWIAAQADPSKTISAVDVKKLPVGRPAPELHAKGWLNSAPLTAKDLAGKVVVYDFWTYSCVNCVRTLPYVRAWYERYQKDGLVVVGVVVVAAPGSTWAWVTAAFRAVRWGVHRPLGSRECCPVFEARCSTRSHVLRSTAWRVMTR